MIKFVKSLTERLDEIYQKQSFFDTLKARLLVGFSVLLALMMCSNVIKLWWVHVPSMGYRLLTNCFIIGAAVMACHWVFRGRLKWAGNVLVLGAVLPIHGLLFIIPEFFEPVAAALLLYSFDLVFLLVALAFATQRVAVTAFLIIMTGFIGFNETVVSGAELEGSLNFVAQTLRREGTLSLLLTFAIGVALVRMLAASNQRSSEALTATKASHDQLEQLVEARTHDLAAATQRADDASRAKSDFLANMSHEIRTPLNGIIAASELILRHPQLPSETVEHARLVTESGELLLKLLGDILDFSKIEAGELTLEAHAFQLKPLLTDTVALLAGRASSQNIHLIHTVDPSLPDHFLADSYRLRQIVLNLLSNAVKFTPPNGHIDLRAELDGTDTNVTKVRFSVRDTGIGMDEETVQRVFQRFTQADSSTTRRFGGTGLGLAISARLVEMMGGTIGVESRPDQGSTFHFTLPLESAPAGSAQRPAVPASISPLGLRILLAEDNPVNRKILVAQLRELGCTCSLAADGVEALNALQKSPLPDVVLMDCHMPNMDGWEATQRLRKWRNEPGATEHERLASELPVVALTAATLPEERARCHAAGMNYFLSKPVKLAALHGRLADMNISGESSTLLEQV